MSNTAQHQRADPEISAPSDDRLSLPFLEAFTPRFRGEIWENSAGVGMGRGYANEGRAFEISSACYLKPVQREIRTRPYGKFVIRAAVQMLKTFGTIEEPAGFFIEHEPGDMGIYLPADASAFDQAKSRLMPRLKAIPGVKRLVEAAEADNRFDITTAEFYLPGMTLRVWPLNESSTQRITLRYVFISDAFLAKRNGLIAQAMARTTQHDTTSLKDYKIIIESQGGDEGDDFDVEWKTTDQRTLHTVCPLCGSGQPFEFHRRRPEGFAARPPLNVPSLDHEAWVAHHSPLLLKPERRDCGFKRGDEELIRRAEGDYNEQEILRGTYYECFHCGGAWRDTPAVRRQLDEASYYVATNANALPENVGFSWPSWAGQRLAWGGEHVMLGYLKGKEALEKYGNVELLRQWYQKRAARAWDPQLTQKVVTVEAGSWDPATGQPDKPLIPDEHSRKMSVDCQKHEQLDTVGTFWYEAIVVDRFGNAKQLARGFARSWEEWIAVQRHWKIPNAQVTVDGRKWTPQIYLRAAAEYEVVDGMLLGRKVKTVSCWKILFGDDARQFRHPDGQQRPWSPMKLVPMTIFDREGKRLVVRLQTYRWSNLAFELQLDAILQGLPGSPKYEVLDRRRLPAATQEKEVNDFTYERQMSAVYLTEKKGKQVYDKLRRNNHYRDTRLMNMVRMSMDGLLGHVAPILADQGNEEGRMQSAE